MFMVWDLGVGSHHVLLASAEYRSGPD